jgi:hypothetical protein
MCVAVHKTEHSYRVISRSYSAYILVVLVSLLILVVLSLQINDRIRMNGLYHRTKHVHHIVHSKSSKFSLSRTTGRLRRRIWRIFAPWYAALWYSKRNSQVFLKSFILYYTIAVGAQRISSPTGESPDCVRRSVNYCAAIWEFLL